MCPTVMAAAMDADARSKSKSDPAGENWMSIELRTITGMDMRIQGGSVSLCVSVLNPQIL